MSWIIAAATGARRVPELLPLSAPPVVHAADQNRAVRASNIPLRALPPDSELRNRLTPALSTNSAEESESNSTSSGATLPPDSSDHTLENRDSSTSIPWKSLLSRIAPAFSFGFELNEGEIKAKNIRYGYNKIKKEKVEELPIGFAQLAFFLSSSDDWAIFRGFKETHARILSQLQIELTELEKELRELDKADEHTATRYRLRMIVPHRNGMDTTQRDLLDKIKAKTKEYDEFLLNHAQIQALGQPLQRNYRSVFSWIHRRKPLCPPYFDFIYHEDDFVSTSGRSERGLRSDKSNALEELIRWYFKRWPKSRFRKFLVTKNEIDKTNDPIIHYYSPARITTMAKILLVFLAVGVLLVPIFLLFLIPMSRVEIVLTILGFVGLFCTVMCSATDGKIQEVLIGSAAYAALLVTCLGNTNPNQPS